MKGILNRTLALAHKESIHIVRDAQVVYMALGMPVVLLFIFGYAISFDLDLLPMGLVDQDNTPASRRLVEAITSSDAFVISDHLRSAEEVESRFRSSDLKVALVIEKGFGRKLKRNEQANAQLLLDGADGTTTNIALGYALGVIQAQNKKMIEQQSLAIEMPLEVRIRALFNPQMESDRFIVPGLIAFILSVMGVLLTSLTVAREWERGSMEQMFSTPVGRVEVIIGKLLLYLLIGIFQVLLVVSLGTLLFDVPIQGSLLLLFFVSLLFLVCVLGQGLFISAATRNQMLSTQIGMISSFLPAVLLSGFMFPIENMPVPLQWLSHLVPARYFITALRGIMLKGSEIAMLWDQILPLFLFSTAMIVLSIVKFKRRLD
jgi:ABC-2 type transport system permease protein